MVDQRESDSYWHKRQSELYYKVFRVLVEGLGKDAGSMLDVGSAGCPYLDWFDFIPDRASMDLHKPYMAPGIRTFTGDFLKWEPDKTYDLVSCLQVLEHVPDAGAFAQKLLQCGKIVIVSVPYKWRKGDVVYHVHDPVDETKMQRWFGRKPNYQYNCQEVESSVSRIIQVYETEQKPWRSLNHRNKLIAKKAGNELSNPKSKSLWSKAKKLVNRYAK
jgi:hypothetical protein